MRPILLTGANGFIGRHVLRRLKRDPATPVRVLVRRPETLDAAVSRGIEIVTGDVRDPDALARAVRGAGTVLHLAAYAQAWARDPLEFSATNVDAVRSLLSLAREHGVRRVVHVSTILALPPFKPAPVNGRARESTLYETTKLAGDRLVEDYVAGGGDAVIVHPTRVYGPGPMNDANAVTRALILYLRGRLRVRLDDGDVLANYVHVDDVAAGILLAAARGRPGAHYILGGEDASFRQVLQVISDITGIRRRVLALPSWAALALAAGAEWTATIGMRPFITPHWVRVFLEDRRADLAPTRADLGYAPRGIHQGFTETADWLHAERLIPA
ncbi:MAG TPA: NAD-dependent epimerase/dehydratase family protein [Gemmatimonadales bacterium]|nr:NAD-dependent epimerase/dehydratase family protein [Gemmatimonadales bacterium]